MKRPRSGWRRRPQAKRVFGGEAAFFELRRKALLIFERADEAVRCAIDEAFGAKFKDGRVGAGRARAGSGAGALFG